MPRKEKDDPFGVYDLLKDSGQMVKDAEGWVGRAADSIRAAKAQVRSSGRPVVTAEQKDFKVRVTGRRYFWVLLGNAFTLLFEGSVTIGFRKRD